MTNFYNNNLLSNDKVKNYFLKIKEENMYLKSIQSLSIILLFLLLPFQVLADKSDDTLVVAFSREITNLDYHYGTKTEYLILGDMIDDSLFYVENENLSYAPSLASGFNVVDDVTLDVELRKGVSFHDGSEMTADDVVYTYNFITKNDKNRRNKKVSSWPKSIEKLASIQFVLI